MPSDDVITVTTIILHLFTEYFKTNKENTNFRKILISLCIERIKKEVPSWLEATSNCYGHRLFIIEHLINCKLHKTLKWMSQDLRLPAFSSSNKKLRNLKHM